MKSYVLGYYVHDPEPAKHSLLMKRLASEEVRKILEALIDSHPTPMDISEIASKAKVNPKTVRGSTYLSALVGAGFVREAEEGEETGGGIRYVVENVNSLSRDKYPKYYLAPGNVEYDEEFKSALDKLIPQAEVKTKFRTFLEFVKYIVESVRQSDEQQIAPKEDSVCSICGLNHEARDFIRATLLYLLDRFERSSYYLEFLREKNYVDREHYNEYCKFIERNLGQGISERLVAETQFTHSKLDQEQIVAEKSVHDNVCKEERFSISKSSEEEILAKYWYKSKKGLTKDVIDWILDKTDISMEKIKNLSETRMTSRSALDAIYKVGTEELGVSYPDNLVVRYDKRKKQEAYENRVRDKTVERRKKLRYKKRNAAQSV
jgi:predicted transcriptional regulator with HTH domain